MSSKMMETEINKRQTTSKDFLNKRITKFNEFDLQATYMYVRQQNDTKKKHQRFERI
jgi:hypothetical protein